MSNPAFQSTVLRHTRRWLRYALLVAVAAFVTFLLVFAIQARVRLPELRSWHTIELSAEFSVARNARATTFQDYLQLEDRLFAELHKRVLDDPAAADTFSLGRYNPASVPARLAYAMKFNRSYELVPKEIRGAALLVHGLTDSPYAMRRLAETFYRCGYYVLALRLPGHGTVPAGLLRVTWNDWYAAVGLAAQHAASRAGPDKPLIIGGFSTGAALATLYSLRTLDDATLPRPSQLVLLSPAIGVSEFAVLTNVIASLSFLPYFKKAEWLDVLPEYDPYKYNSFPVNAANQIYKLTQELQRALEKAQRAGRLERMPRVLAFQSLVDATISAAEVARGLFLHLPPGNHELVVFDVNRYERFEGLLAPGPREALELIRSTPSLPFRLTLIANLASDSRSIAAYSRAAGTREVQIENLMLEWPPGVFSLSHVALPFAPDDPVYGLAPAGTGRDAYPLGALSVRGESGTLVVPLGNLARLRSNPFFAVIETKVEAVARSAAASRGSD
jgi:alpha-beta hydrolase superfamily lysophospholipase